MRDAGAWCAAGIVVAWAVPLLVRGSALPMMLGLILLLLVRGSLTYGRRGALGFFARAYLVAFAFKAPAIATGSPERACAVGRPAGGRPGARGLRRSDRPGRCQGGGPVELQGPEWIGPPIWSRR